MASASWRLPAHPAPEWWLLIVSFSFPFSLSDALLWITTMVTYRMGYHSIHSIQTLNTGFGIK